MVFIFMFRCWILKLLLFVAAIRDRNIHQFSSLARFGNFCQAIQKCRPNEINEDKKK